jgi:hypothetical protein
MAYASYSDVQARAYSSGKTFSSNQQTRCGTVLTQVSNYIDGNLGSLWEVPISAPYPQLVVDAAILLGAGWFLMGEFADQPQLEAVRVNALGYIEAGEALVARILNRPSLLSGTSAVLRADVQTAIGPQMRVSTHPPSITFQDSSKWLKPAASAAFMTRQAPKEYP